MRELVAVLAVGAVTLVGCGGGRTSSAPPRTAASKPGDGEFSSVVSKVSESKYKITFQSGSSAPFTIAQDPPRFSYRSGSSGTYVTAAGSAVTCSGTGSSATCTEMPGSGSAIKQGLNAGFGVVGALFFGKSEELPGLASISKTSTRTIAGREALCATFDGSILGALGAAIKASYSVCVDRATGAVLESRADDGNGHVSDVRAIAFGNPTAADLTPPATPVTIPGVTPTT